MGDANRVALAELPKLSRPERCAQWWQRERQHQPVAANLEGRKVGKRPHLDAAKRQKRVFADKHELHSVAVDDALVIDQHSPLLHRRFDGFWISEDEADDSRSSSCLYRPAAADARHHLAADVGRLRNAAQRFRDWRRILCELLRRRYFLQIPVCTCLCD